MALQKQNAVFPMAKGVETRIDPKQLVTGSMEVLENVQFTSPGQYLKRFGYENLSTITNPQGLGVLGDTLVAFHNNTVSAYSPGSESFVGVKIPNSTSSLNFQPCQLSIQKGISNFDSLQSASCAYHTSGRIAFTGTSAQGTTHSNAFFSILDYESGATIYGPYNFSSNSFAFARVWNVGGYFIIVYWNSTNLKYIAVPVGTTSGSLSAGTTLSSVLPASARIFDGCVFGGKLYIVWGIASGSGGNIGIASIDSQLSVRTYTVVTNDNPQYAMNITPDSTTGYLSITYFNGTDVKYLQVDQNFNTVLPKVTVETIGNVGAIAATINNNTGYIYYQIKVAGVPNGTTYNDYIKRSVITAAVPQSPSIFLRSVGLISKPFNVSVNDETVTCVLVGYTGAQPGFNAGTDFLVNTSGVVIAKLSPGNCNGNLEVYNFDGGISPTEFTSISDTLFVGAFCRTSFGFTNEAGTEFSRYSAYSVTFDFDSLESYQNTQAANNLHVTTGTLQMYDGGQFVEHGFHLIAEAPSAVVASYDGSTNNFPPGDYSYVICYEWFDEHGNFHQGVPSTPFVKTVGSNQTKLTLTIPTLRITQKYNVFLSVYRNTLSALTVFNRVEQTPIYLQLNSTSADSISYEDTSPDTTISGHAILYTNGGVVPNYAVPSPRFVCGYRNRLVLLPNETPNILWISKEIVQGIPPIPVEFSAFFTIQINTLGGEVYAFSQMDEKGVIFKRNTIFYFVGDGPSDTGANNDLSIPQQIPTDVGTTNQRSVLLMHLGVMFQSENNGIYLLDRSLSVSYVGAPVEAYNNDTVVSSQVIPESTQVRFLLDSGVALVYDYVVQQWSVYTNHSGVDAVIYQNKYTYLTTHGKTFQENSDYSDDGEYISMLLKTGWLSFSGIQGFQRVWKMLILGTYKDAHQLVVKFAFDYNPNPFQEIVMNPTTVFNNDVYGDDATYGESTPYGGEYPLEQFTFYPEIQKCETMQVTIYDAQYLTTIGEGYAISSLGFEVGVEGGLQRQPATRKFG